MQTITYNGTEYPLYANGDVVGIKCYLDGYNMDMTENGKGWTVTQVNEINANEWEIADEAIEDFTSEEGFDAETERFNREQIVYVTVPLVTEMRKQPIALTYATTGDDISTNIDSVANDAAYANGAIIYDGMIEVYNTNGTLVAYKKNQVNINELNNGIYIVRCGNKTMKIVR